MNRSLILTPLIAVLAACAATQTPETAKAAADVCKLHADAATVAAVNEASGLSAQDQARKKLALDIFCTLQAPPPK